MIPNISPRPKKVTKEQLDEVYSRPINPLKPFERLQTLMRYAISEMEKYDERIEKMSDYTTEP